MWLIQTIVCLDGGPDGQIFRPISKKYKAGRIPSRDKITQDAYDAALKWVSWLKDTVGSGRDIDYGEPCGITIIAPVFLPN